MLQELHASNIINDESKLKPNYFHYHPQTKFAKVMFSQASVSHSVHGGEGVCPKECWDIHTPRQTPHPQADTPPPGRHTPPGQTPPRQTPPFADTPSLGRHPLHRQTPPSSKHYRIRSTSWRHASYWNAFLLSDKFSFSKRTDLCMIQWVEVQTFIKVSQLFCVEDTSP